MLLSNSPWIDVNFQQACPTDQALGCIHESPQDMFAAAPVETYSSYTPLYSRSEWKERSALISPKLRNCVRNKKNQKNEGSCVFNAVTGKWEFMCNQQFGWDGDTIILSAIIGYSIYGSSPGSGSMVSDAVKFMTTTGCIPESGHGYTDPHQFAPTGYYDAKTYRKNNPDWTITAANYMSLAYYSVNTVEEWATALLNGHPIIKGRDGHCIFDIVWEEDEKGNWYAGYPNSWGDWGDICNEVVGKCMGWDSERSIDRQSGYAMVGVKVTPRFENRILQPVVAL